MGDAPDAIAITPNGRTAYVAVAGLNEVVPIVTATNTTLPPIRVGPLPGAIAITPNGKTVYAANPGMDDWDTVTPINTATNKALPAITVGLDPFCVAITPDGGTAYVAKHPLEYGDAHPDGDQQGGPAHQGGPRAHLHRDDPSPSRSGAAGSAGGMRRGERPAIAPDRGAFDPAARPGV